MAAGGKEHRMVFDIRGRRRHVVKVVYAVLALLMGASLFLVVGPVNIGGLFGNSNGTSAGAQISIEQAEKIERKLKKSPEDEALLLSLTRARIQAGNTSQSVNPETGEVAPTTETRQQYAKASEAWSKYLKAADEPSAAGAQLIAPALFSLAQISRTPNEILANFRAAADAQQIVVDQRANLNSLSKFALYKMYTFDYAAAEKAGNEAEKLASNKFERENFENQLEETKKSVQEFQKSVAKLNKEEKSNGSGKARLENPLSGPGVGSSLGP